MPHTFTVNLDRPITSVKILDPCSHPAVAGETFSSERDAAAVDAPQIKLMQDSDNEKARVTQLCRTLKGLVDKLNQFYDKLFSEHREEIAKLSVEIARKVLVQKVQQGDYEIESIVKEALKNAPTHQDMVVHLNPEDLVQCQKVQQDDSTGALSGIKFVADPKIGRAQCLLETPKGIIESVIDEHLEQIGKALEKAE